MNEEAHQHFNDEELANLTLAIVDAAALPSILHDHRRIVEFDGRIDMKLLANHRCDALVHECTGGTFIVPQIDSASGPAVLRTQELFPD